MKQLCIGTAVLAAALIGAPVLAYAQMPVDIGKREYLLACAVCHGDSGKGDCPVVEYLKKPAADLTKIQKNNSGVFPFDRLYEVIDGREAVGAHGPRDMPVSSVTNAAIACPLSGSGRPTTAASATAG